MGLLFNIHFLTTNGISMNKRAPLHVLMDFHLWFQEGQFNQIPIEIDLEVHLQKARYFSLLLDESSDITCQFVNCQFLDADKKKVELKFMKLVVLQECDTESTFRSVVKYFDEIQISLESLIMFTSDGASVILGCDNGVQAKLKSVFPHTIEFHCMAHREAFSVSQAYQFVDYFIQVEVCFVQYIPKS